MMTEGLNAKRKRSFPMKWGDTGIPLRSNRYDSHFLYWGDFGIPFHSNWYGSLLSVMPLKGRSQSRLSFSFLPAFLTTTCHPGLSCRELLTYATYTWGQTWGKAKRIWDVMGSS